MTKMKTMKLLSFVAFLFLTAFTSPVPSQIEIQCEKNICGCDADFGKISGIYKETKKSENGQPVFLGPDKNRSYEIKLRAEVPKGADFTVYRWEVRATSGELVYFDSNIKIEPFSFSEIKGQWTAEKPAFNPVPNKVARRL